jgi:hypothetical protein
MFAWGMGLFICTKPMAKRNQHAKQGFGVTNPEDAIHLGEDKFIRLESDLPESSEGDKRVGRRSYNDARYLRVVISGRYANQAAMFAAQANQKTDRVYYEAETETFWVYLGTVNGDITDYQQFGAGITDVGAGLSIDGDENPQFGKEEDGIYYLDGDEFDDWNGFVFASNFDNYYNGTGGVFGFFEILGDSPQFGFEDLDLEKAGFFRLNENIVGVQSSGTGARIDIEQIPPDDVGVRRMTMLNSFLITDTVSNKGLENEGDYEANFTARSLVTKQYVDGVASKYNESQLVSTVAPLKFDLDYQIGSPANPVSGNITFDLTGATMGSAVSVFHQSASAPTFGTNIDKALINFTLADYDTVGLNEFVFHYMEDPNNANDPYLKIYHTKNITVVNAI